MATTMTPLSLVVFVACVLGVSSGSVVVVGAGAAGIAAATRLLENDVTDVVVLEAERRIGGRILSVKVGETFVDLGAEWCYGEEGNVVHELVRDLHVLQHSNLDNFRFYYSTGEEVDKVLNEKLWQITLHTCTWDCNRGQDEEATLEDYCSEKYNSAVSDLNLDDPKEIKLASDVFDFFRMFLHAAIGTFSWSSPSARCDLKLLPGYPSLNWGPFGFKTVLDVMVKKSPTIDDKIVFNKEVAQIVWDEGTSSGATVRCTDGSEYSADHVIFTPSLGVLKQKHETMFQPELPAYKRAAIETLGIDAIVKVILRFRNDWWRQEDFTGINIIYSSGGDKYSKLLGERNMTWVYNFMGFYPSPNNTDVLIAWFVGPHVPEIERLSDEALLEGINFILDVFLGHLYDVSEPYDFIRSWWYSNAHYGGTTSFQTVASRRAKSNEDLSRPLSNNRGDMTLLFAGEATHESHYSTVHGAIETGYREAERLLSRLK